MVRYKIVNASIKFTNSYLSLPEKLYQVIDPVPVKAPTLICFNTDLAKELNLNLTHLSNHEIAQIFSGNIKVVESYPIALAYAGHQFGHFVPQLGDGRAILLGELKDIFAVERDIQLKGSGQTRFSRNGDGRYALGPALREYILSEAMHALGIQTTRALALITTGESVIRHKILPGAIITRVAHSHIRIGTFEFLASQNDYKSIKILSDYLIERHYPNLKNISNRYFALLETIIDSQALLIAQWMQYGFIHGVMNTDNTSIMGETIDYGPCAFMDHYNLNTVYSSIDYYGRYAYGNQANIAQWNLRQLARCMLPLLDVDTNQAIKLANKAIESFKSLYENYWLKGMCSKIGISNYTIKDQSLVHALLEQMNQHQVDYTLCFRNLSYSLENLTNPTIFTDLFSNDDVIKQWLEKWHRRLRNEDQPRKKIVQLMQMVNPAFIPRNHRIEYALKQAEEHNNFSELKRLIIILSNPYMDQPLNIAYMQPPNKNEVIYKTYCGT